MPGRHDITLLITGGAGFIGSHLADLALARGHRVVVLDALTYAGSIENLEAARCQPGFTFVKGDIGDRALVADLLAAHPVDRVFHLAAESHVDNSIAGPEPFLRTNVDGTFHLLEACRTVWERRAKPGNFRFVHVSTDEVFGDLGPDDPPFDETTPYRPSSPYSASKAASDLFARAWFRTFGLPVIVTNCSNNFGPRQHTEKLIPDHDPVRARRTTRCPSTATAATSVTGFTSATTAAACCSRASAARPAKLIAWAAGRSCRTSNWSAASARIWTTFGHVQMGARMPSRSPS